MNFLKWIFVALNSLIILITTIVTILSVILVANSHLSRRMFDFVIVDDEEWLDMVVAIGRRLALLILPLALVIWIVAICGTVGVSCQKGFLVQLYTFGLLMMVLGTLIVILIIGIKQKATERRIVSFIADQLAKNYNGDHTGQSSTATLLVDSLQIYFQCCGMRSGHEDYRDAQNWPSPRTYANYSGLSYPASCCTWRSGAKKRFVLPFRLEDEDTCVAHSISLGEKEDSGNDPSDEDDEIQQASERFASNADISCSAPLIQFFDSKIGIAYATLGAAIIIEFVMSMVACAVTREIKSTS